MYHNHRKTNRICMLEEMQLLPLEIREKHFLQNARSKNKLQKNLVTTLTNYGQFFNLTQFIFSNNDIVPLVDLLTKVCPNLSPQPRP